jgi:hypothetical protein
LSDSVFQLHNDFILWVFDNYEDSVDYYYSNPVGFANFTSRKWHSYTGETVNIANEVIHNNEIFLTSPYYTYNEGFTDENLFTNFSNVELDYIYTVLDSVYDAAENRESEVVIQQLITNGKNRIIVANPDHKNGLINTLKQASFSLSLAFELDDIYGGNPGPALQSWFWCFFVAINADIEIAAVYQEIDTNGGSSGHLANIAYLSMWTLNDCWHQ